MHPTPRASAREVIYDKKTFTGAHKKGGPTTVGSDGSSATYGGADGFKNLMSRDHVQDDAVQRRKVQSTVGSGGIAKKDSSKFAPGSRAKAKAGTGSGELKGPERFFYDKKTFTGAHKKGGPSTNDKPSNLDLTPDLGKSGVDEASPSGLSKEPTSEQTGRVGPLAGVGIAKPKAGAKTNPARGPERFSARVAEPPRDGRFQAIACPDLGGNAHSPELGRV